MFKTIKNLYLKVTKAVFDSVDSHARSPQWGKLEKQMIAAHPQCEVCDAKEHLQVHHVKPFHLHPELELNPSNLVVLCMKPGVECHLYVGHGGSWKAYNPNLALDIVTIQNDPSKRESVIAEAKKNRQLV